VFAAAAEEFATHGYAGANMDRVARAARLNKAMIYYHFGSKAALYRAILRDMFDAVAVRVEAVAGATDAPDEKVRRFVETIADEAAARPHFPPIWLREVAEGGEHVDTATLEYARSVLAALARIIEQGRAAGRFQAANPLLVHGGIIAPLMFFFATDRIRRKFERAGLRGASVIPRDVVVAHIQRLALAVLEGRIA
jgi:TetR/AcrR family transcriptional regulator